MRADTEITVGVALFERAWQSTVLDAMWPCGLQTVMLRMVFIRGCLTEDVFLKEISGDNS